MIPQKPVHRTENQHNERSNLGDIYDTQAAKHIERNSPVAETCVKCRRLCLSV